jgi:tetratricopeptide (TPR) repeat protein
MKKILVSLMAALVFAVSGPAQAQPDASKDELQRLNAEIVALYRQNKFAEALPLAQKSVRLTEQAFGREHLETARALRNLGMVELSGGDAEKAADAFERSVDIYKKAPDLDRSNGASYAEVLETLAQLKFRKQIDSAEDLYERALVWREKTGGADSGQTVKPLLGLASIN